MDLIDFLNENGLETKVERGGRVFPVSDNAKDVVKVLLDYIIKIKSRLYLKSAVKEIKSNRIKVKSVLLRMEEKLNVIQCYIGNRWRFISREQALPEMAIK